MNKISLYNSVFEMVLVLYIGINRVLMFRKKYCNEQGCIHNKSKIVKPKRVNQVSLVLVFLILILLASCSEDKENIEDINHLLQKDGELSYPYSVVVTTAFVNDIVEALASDYTDIYQIMGSGIDPHTYTPTRSDIVEVYFSDLIVYSGLHLEGGMYNVFNRIGEKRSIFSVANVLDGSDILFDGEGANDPHIWMDAKIWIAGSVAVAEALSKFDDKHASEYKKNLLSYRESLIELDTYMKSLFDTIPSEQRVLITSHDAFSYFGRSYGFEVYGIQGISTVSEASLKHIAELIDIIVEKNVPAIFVESSVSEKYVKALIEGARSRGYDLKEGGLLYADAMGAPGTEEDNYVGMMKYNARTITKALGGRVE